MTITNYLLFILLSLLVHSTTSAYIPLSSNEDIYTVDGSTDCSQGGITFCSSLGQALDSIQKIHDDADSDHLGTEYAVRIATPVSDTSERPIYLNFSLLIEQNGTGLVRISNDTTSSSIFMTIGTETTPADISVTINGLNFNLNATETRPITGHIFEVSEVMATKALQATLSLQYLSIVGSNGQNTAIFSTYCLFKMRTGTLHLTKVTVSDVTVTDESLIMTSGNLYTENLCKFIRVKSTYSTDDKIGGVITCNINGDAQITILGTHFQFCTAGYGGGAINIYVQNKTNCSLEIGGMHYNEEVRFKGCEAAQKGGAFYLNEKDNLVVHFNRIDYLNCVAHSPTCPGNNIYFVTTAVADSVYYLEQIEKILAGQTPTGTDYIASFKTSEGQAEPVEYTLSDLVTQFGCTIELQQTTTSACELTQLESDLAKTLNIKAGQKGTCNSLESALRETDLSSLPIGNHIHIHEDSNLQPSNFTGVAERSAIIFGDGNTITLSLTHLFSNPLLQVGPGFRDKQDQNDRVIMLIIKDTTFSIQRTESVYLRHALFKINNQIRTYSSTDGSYSGDYTEEQSTSLHYLELDNVVIMSGLEFDEAKGIVPFCASAVTFFDCDPGTTLMLRTVTVKNIQMLNRADQVDPSPSLVDAKGATLLLLNCHFENITTPDSPLLNIDPFPGSFGMEMPNTVDSPTLQTCNLFRGITRTTGSGAVFNVDLSKSAYPEATETPYLPLTFAYFTVVSAKQGNGAAVYINSLDSPDQVYWESVLFSGCAAQRGNRAYVVTESCTAAEIAASWSPVNKNTVLNNDYQLATSQSSTTSEAIFDHTSYDWLIMVDVNRGVDAGNENGECGLPATIPCKSIYMAYNHRTDVSTIVGMASGDYPADKRPITFLSSITVRGEVPSNTFVTKKAAKVAGGVFIVSDRLQQGVVTFQTISFLILSEIFRPGETEGFERPLDSPLFVSNFPGSYQFIDLSFQMGDLSSPIFQYDTIHSPLIEATSGTILLQDCTFDSLYFSPGAEVYETEAQAILKLAGVTFNNITLSTRPLFSLSDIATDLSLDRGLSNQQNSFTNVHRLSGSGAIFDVKVGGIYGIILQNCDFINCTCDEESLYGDPPQRSAVAGAVHATLTGRDGLFYVDPASVTFELLECSPYFDAKFNAPWRSAITFSADDVRYSWQNSTGTEKTSINIGTYLYNLTNFKPTWDDAQQNTMYYLYVTDGSTTSYNNTFLYSFNNHVNSSTATPDESGKHVAMVDPAGGDLPGCGEPNRDDAIPCLTVDQAFVNLNPSDYYTHFINLTAGTHETLTTENAKISSSVTIAGYITRGLLKTTLSHESPGIIASSSNGPVRILDLIVRTTSGSFLVNTGEGGVTLENMPITGIHRAPANKRLTTPFLTSSVGPMTLHYLTVSSITLLNTTFTQLAGGSLTIMHSTFTDVLGHSPGTGGTVIAFTLSTAAPFSMTNCTFTTCHSQKHGGALTISIPSSGAITLTDCTFVDNSAVGNGGSIYISGTQKWTEFDITNVEFDGNLGTNPQATATYGAYVFFESQNPNADITGTDIAEFLDYRLIDNQFCAQITSNEEPVNFYELENLLYIGGDGANADSTCGTAVSPCTTLYAASKSSIASATQCLWIRPIIIRASSDPIEIPKALTIVGHTDSETNESTIIHLCTLTHDSNGDEVHYHDESSYKTEDQNVPACIRIYNKQGEGTILVRITNIVFRGNSSAVGGYTIRNRMIRCEVNTKLMLDTCTFTSLDSENRMVTLWRSIVFAQDCTEFKLFDVVFTNITLLDAPLINIPSKHGKVFQVSTTSTFQHITRKKGNGAVIEETLDDTSALSFANVIFNDCVCEEGNGGALAIIYQAGKLTMGDTEDPDTGTYRDTEFINCRAPKGDGGAIFFDFEQATQAPAIDPNADAFFILQHVRCSGPTGASKHGYYFCAHGKKGVVNEITLWKDIIRATNETGWYQFLMTDTGKDDDYSDVFSSVPSTISVVLDTEADPDIDQTNPKCTKCPTIPLALRTYADFAPAITLEFEERVAPGFDISIDHSVVITGTNTKIIVPITHATHDCFLNVNTKRIEFGLTHITFEMDTDQKDYPYDVRVVLITEQATVNLQTITFIGKGDNYLKKSLVNAVKGMLTLDSCTFSLLKMADFQLLNVPTQAKCFYMTGHNLFNTITAVSSDPSNPYKMGTIFSVTLEEGTGLLVENANFSNCRATEDGQSALFYFNILDEPTFGTFGFDNIYFQEVEQSNAVTTYCKVVSTLTDYMETSGPIWTALFNHQDYDPEAFRWYYGNDVTTAAVYYSLKDYRYYNFYCSVYSEVNDPTQCEEDSLCPYFHYAADLANTVLVEESSIHIAAGVLDSDALKGTVLRSVVVSGYVSDAGMETILEYEKVSTGSLALISVGIGARRLEHVNAEFVNLSVLVKSTAESRIYVPLFGVVSQYGYTARLIINSMTFALNTDIGLHKHAGLLCPLIDALSGVLCVKDTTFQNLIIQNDPLLAVTPRLLESDGSEPEVLSHDIEFAGKNLFQNITRNEGNGTIFCLTLTNYSYFYLQNCEFNLNSAAYGACVYICVYENVTAANYDWDPSTLTFNLPGTYDDGAYVYLHVENLLYVSETYRARMRQLVAKETDVQSYFVEEVRAGEFQDIYQFFEDHQDPLVVSSDPADYFYLREAINAFNQDPTATRIFLKRNLDDPPVSMELSRNLAISGIFADRSRAYIPIVGLSTVLYSVTGTLKLVKVSINTLAFHLTSTPENPIEQPLFLTDGEYATLFLSSTSFEPTQAALAVPLTVPLINCIEGTVGLSKIEMRNLELIDRPLVSLPDDLDNFGVFALSHFTNITRRKGSGSVFQQSVEAGDVLTLKNLIFINCVAQNGNGGAVDISVHLNGGFTCQNVQFINCVATGTVPDSASQSKSNSDDTRGGGMHILVDGEPVSFSFSKTTVTSNSASIGKSIYIDMTAIEAFSTEQWTLIMDSMGGVSEGDIIANITKTDPTTGITSTSLIDLEPYLPKEESTEVSTSTDKAGFPTWAIILIIVLSIAVIVVIVVLFFCCKRKSQ